MLLAFMLVLITGAAYLLVAGLNEHAESYFRDTQTQVVLGAAKRALLSYAMNYPELRAPTVKGPGFLPCPDRHAVTDPLFGNPSSNCALATGTTLGRLPFRILGFEDVRDGSGSHLWYAVSDNFKNTSSNDTVLNSETPGQLSVDGAGDVVAVIIAPGEPVASQSGRPSSNEADYLEDDNATAADGSFVTTSTSEFNDRVVTVTRQEVMQAVERRVISEVRAILAAYRSSYGAYPWLAPFADPKAASPGFWGTHDGTNDMSDVTDTTVNFLDELGVQIGDLVRNVTDGSVATVSGVSANTLTLDPLLQGTENDFDTGDEYQILSALQWTASGGSSSVVLVDASRDFEEIGVVAGDVIDNVTDNSSGVVASVSGSQITLDEDSGVDFSVGDNYVIRGPYGQATGANDSSALADANKNFVTLGVLPGDMVVNLSDGSVGRVASVAANVLTLDGLYLGTDNDFDTGDYYYLPRLNTDNSTREGLLSVHESGKHFPTSLSMDWDLTQVNGATVVTNTNAGSPHATYVANLEEASSGILGTVDVARDEGQCVWVAEDEAYCMAYYMDPGFPIQGTVTSGTNTSTLTDANADFLTPDVKRGDMARNFDDEVATGITGTMTSGTSSDILEDTSKNFITLGIQPYFHLLHNNSASNARALITEVISSTTLRVVEFQGGAAVTLAAGDNYTIYTPQRMVVTGITSATQLTTSRLISNPDFDNSGGGGGAGEFYQINVATGLTSDGTADAGSSGTTLYDAGADFSEIEPGDIVENITDNAFGLIISANDASDELVAQLYAADGSARNFDAGESYRIYYNHDVVTRRYELRPRFSGSVRVYSSSNQRKRDVCLGYSSDCLTLSGNVTVPAQSAVITVRDLDGSNNEVARTEVSIPTGGAQGSIRLSGLDYYLREATNELPAWFLENRWHQLVYAAFSGAYAPSVTTANGCPTDGPCLQLSIPIPIPAGTTYDDKHAIVIAAGGGLAGQDRSSGSLSDYYEPENADGDDVFQKDELTTTFNDQISVVCPDGLNPICP